MMNLQAEALRAEFERQKAEDIGIPFDFEKMAQAVLTTTTVATAATDARAIVEACAEQIEREYRDVDYVAEMLRAKAPEIIAALPQAGEVESRKLVCKHCSLDVDRNAGGLRHKRNQHSPSSCGRKLTYDDVKVVTTPPSVIPAAAVENALEELEGSDFEAVRRHAATLRAALLPTPAEGLTERYREEACANPVQDTDPRQHVLREIFSETAILLTHSDPARTALAKERVYALLYPDPLSTEQGEGA